MQINFASHLLPSKAVVVAGISGGPDSLCLLHLLHNKCKLNNSVIVAHFNHKLRPEADAEQTTVQRIARKMGMQFIPGSSDVAAVARADGSSIEEAARKLRYQFLFEQARKHGASAVVVAHTADDQVETVLMHILRGSGLKGLVGMREESILPEFDPNIPLIRPLLRVWREEIEHYCQTSGLQPVDDASNQDQSYLRNRLRLSLIPEMETYNPRFKKALIRMTQILADDDEVLNVTVDNLWEKTVRETARGYVAFHLSVWTALSPGIRRNLLRRAVQYLKSGICETSFDTLQRVACMEYSGYADLSGGLYAHVEGEVLYVAGWEADLPSAQWPQIDREFTAGLNERIDLGHGWFIITAEQDHVPSSQCLVSKGDEMQTWLDADLIGNCVKIRPRHSGERFQPFGMGGKSMKISDFFINVKIPQRARDKWPLFCVGDSIAWVPGFRLAHLFRVTEKTRRVVHVELHKDFK